MASIGSSTWYDSLIVSRVVFFAVGQFPLVAAAIDGDGLRPQLIHVDGAGVAPIDLVQDADQKAAVAGLVDQNGTSITDALTLLLSCKRL